jgi:hypothetical protein
MLGLFLHLPVATIGGVVLGLLLDGILLRPFFGLRHDFHLAFYNPLFWITAFVLGLLINRRTRHRSAYWCAAITTFCLILVIWSDLSGMRSSQYAQTATGGHFLRYELSVLFSPECRGSKCVEQIFVTAPFITSLAYAMGAWLAMRFPAGLSSSQNHTSTASTSGQ